jgi:hypothetical protein
LKKEAIGVRSTLYTLKRGKAKGEREKVNGERSKDKGKRTEGIG